MAEAALRIAPNVRRPDEVFQWLRDAHDGLSDDESRRLDARLVLVLINHIGHEDVIAQAIATARAAGERK